MLGVRLEPELEASLASLAKRTRRSKSDIARQAIRHYIGSNDDTFLAEAKRQSLHAAQFDDPEEDAFWESISSWNDDE